MKRTVLITGATSDIGREIVSTFAAEGWDAICHYCSSEQKARELEALVRGYGGGCRTLKADFTVEAEIGRFLEEIEGSRIDTLVNNAGTYIEAKHYSELVLDVITATFMVNAFAPMLIASRLMGGMKERGWGRIVNVSSIATKYGGSSSSMHYGCAKRALEGMTKTLARDGAEAGVLVNTLQPGVIDTDFHRKFKKDMAKRIDMIPLKRMGTPGEVAEMAFFLGSDKNSFVTNQTIAVSGGE